MVKMVTINTESYKYSSKFQENYNWYLAKWNIYLVFEFTMLYGVFNSTLVASRICEIYTYTFSQLSVINSDVMVEKIFFEHLLMDKKKSSTK